MALESCKGKPLSVILDVVTRWWSTFLIMIARLLELRTPIDVMANEGQLGGCEPLTPVDWENLSNIMLVLKPFKEAQKLWAGWPDSI